MNFNLRFPNGFQGIEMSILEQITLEFKIRIEFLHWLQDSLIPFVLPIFRSVTRSIRVNLVQLILSVQSILINTGFFIV